MIYGSTELTGSGSFNTAGNSSTGVQIELAGQVSPALDMNLGLNLIRARQGVQGMNPTRRKASSYPRRASLGARCPC